jgi:hypothetical protein
MQGKFCLESRIFSSWKPIWRKMNWLHRFLCALIELVVWEAFNIIGQGFPNARCLEDQITEPSAHIHAVTYRLLVLIHEYDDYDGWEGPGMKSCAHWLNWKCGISLDAAREKVRVNPCACRFAFDQLGLSIGSD